MLLVVSTINYIDRWSKSHLNATAMSLCVTRMCWCLCQDTVGFSYLFDCISFFLALFLRVCIYVSNSKYKYFYFYFLTSSYFSCLSFLSFRIHEAADFKDHKIQVASCLISLKVEPSPALSINLSGAPLIKIVLTHVLVGINQYKPYLRIWLLSLSAIYRCVTHSYWENGVFRFSSWRAKPLGVGHPAYQRGKRPQFACGCSSRIPPYEIYQLYFWAFSYVRRWVSITDRGLCSWALTNTKSGAYFGFH